MKPSFSTTCTPSKLWSPICVESSTHAEQVNAIIHPIVKEDFLQWKQRQHTPWVAIESAILYESGFNTLADKVLTVYAPESIRIERACQRDHATPEAIKARIARQMPDEEKVRLSDFTLHNEGNHAILPQILDILANLFCLSRKWMLLLRPISINEQLK